MKKRLIITIAVFVCIVAGITVFLYVMSGKGYPDKAADGADWDNDWEMLGPVLALEEPGNGLTLRDSSAALTTDQIFYATWTAGDSERYTTADGQEAQVYDAQLYLLAQGCADGEKAAQAVQEWSNLEMDAYTVHKTRTAAYNGQTYDLLYYDCGSGDTPYDRGVAAFTVYGNYAVSAELACQADFDGDEAVILADVLSRCHYSADIGK